MNTIPFHSLKVALEFDRHSAEMRQNLMHLRSLVFDTAANADDIGRIEETTRWGQASYITRDPHCGTTLRIAADESVDGKYGLYVHCQSRLIDTMRETHPTELTYEGTRAVVFDSDSPVPEAAVRHFIEQALTYHRWK